MRFVKRYKGLIGPLAIIVLFQPICASVEASDAMNIKKLSYPELEVTPRASARLLLEAKKEKSRRWETHFPVQVSGLATLTAALLANGRPAKGSDGSVDESTNDNNGYSSTVGLIIGGGWLAATSYLALKYQPYAKGHSQVRRLPAKTKREQLTRERLAEEWLRKPAQLATKLKWISVISNFAASAFIAGNGDDDVAVAGAVSGLLAFTPLLFEYRWTDVYNQHQEYKKKIYGPIGHVRPIQGKDGLDLVPGVSLAMTF